MSRSRRAAQLAGAAIAVSVAAACSAGDRSDSADSISVDVFGPYRTTEADAFVSSLRRFSDRTGIDVRYTGSADFVAELRTRSLGGQPPDIAVIPQPALVDELIEAGLLDPLSDESSDIVGAEFGLAADAAPDTHDGFGVPFRTTIKSLVWYRPEVFDANGWQVPATLDELGELVDTIADSEVTSPWCLGVRSGAATGWPASDWLEDLLLRSAGPDAYERLAAGRFDEIVPELTEAFTLFDELVGEAAVTDGRSSAVITDVADAAPLLFSGDCAMFKQADFALSWMPDGTTVGSPDGGDVAAFILPGLTDDAPPLVVGGDTVVRFAQPDLDDDSAAQRDAVDQVMAFLASADGAADWAARGGYLSSRVDVERTSYFDENTQAILDLVDGASITRFDASDQLPIEFGFDIYLPALTRWVAGSTDTTSLVEFLADIAAADDTDG